MVDNIAVKCIFFNQPYLKKKIELHGTVTVKGKWNRAKQRNKWKQDVFNEQSQDTSEIKLEPVYRIKEGIKQKQMRDMIYQTLDDVTIHEWLTEELKQKYKLESLEDTLHALHRQRIDRTYYVLEEHMLLLSYLCLN